MTTDQDTANAPFLISWRFVVTIMCFWSLTNMMYLRLNMSVAIVCMVNNSHLTSVADRDIGNNISTGSNTNRGNGSSLLSGVREIEDGPLNWDSFIQGQVLGAYYYGYAVSKIPTGWAVRIVGGKKLILASSLVASITCLLIPVVAIHSAIAIILMRVVMGVCGCQLQEPYFGYESLHCQDHSVKSWNLSRMKECFLSFVYKEYPHYEDAIHGFPCGALAAFILSGLLCAYGFAGGWPSVFYTFGMCSLVFCLLWTVAVSESPVSHSCIGKGEKAYIQDSLSVENTSQKKRGSVPWKSLLTSLPVYAVAVCGISTDFVGSVFLLYLPTYMVEVMNIDIASSGLLSALPYLFCFLALTLGGHLSDCLIRRTKLSRGTVRKLMSGSGMLVCLVSLICISFIDSSQAEVAIVLLILSMSGIGLMTIGYFVNPLDIAPEYSGVVVGIASTAGDVCGFISPAIVAAITSQGSPQESWQIVFLMSAGVIGCCFIFYICFASGEIQPWAKALPETPSPHTLTPAVVTATSSRDFKVTDTEQDFTERLLPNRHLYDSGQQMVLSAKDRAWL